MATQYVPLSLLNLQAGAHLSHPDTLPELVYLDDPACYVMHDFQHEQASSLHANDLIANISHNLHTNHVHEMLVMEGHEIIGIISTRDLIGVKPTKISQEKQIHRDEITARMLMTPCKDVLVLEINELSSARVGNVAVTLNQHKKAYALVVEVDELSGEQTVRGLISAVTISEQLGKDISKIA